MLPGEGYEQWQRGYTRSMSLPPDEHELATSAVRAFEEAHENPPEDLVPSFRLWHYPRKGPWITWVLFVPPGGEPVETDGKVRELGWDRPAPGPELWTRDAVVPAADLRRTLSRAGRTALLGDHLRSRAAFPDWTEYGIEGFSSTRAPDRIQWESPVPYPFRTLAAWYSRARALLRDCVDRSGRL